jgi:chloramphenicol 3-O phosphotransferase
VNRRIIVLQGPSSSGKTTLGRALSRAMGPEAVFLPIDLLWQSVHPDRPNDWTLFERLTGVLFETALAFWKRGADVVVDTVFERQACADECQRTLAPAAPLLVGLFCGLAELERRERARGDRPRGLALGQSARVHGFCAYDLRLQTDLTSVEACVAEILALRAGRIDPQPPAL